MKRLILGLVAASCTLLAAPAFAQGQLPPETGVLNKMMGVHRFDTFLELVRVSDTTRMFMGNQSYTFFAPTEEAFAMMSVAQVDRLRNNPAAARRFVLSHVVRGSYTAEQAVKQGRLTTVAGTTIRFRNVRGHGRIGNAQFVLTNVPARNGFVHGIDRPNPMSGVWRRS